MTRRRWGLLLSLAVAILLLAGRFVAGLVVDYRWYEALGAASVFRARLADLSALRSASFVLSTLLVFANLYAVRYSVASVVLPRRVGNIEIGEELPSKYLLWTIVLISLGLGALFALPNSDWMSLDLVRSGEVFREGDPYFQVDLAFWVYWLPLETSAHLWALASLFGITLLVVFLYALTPSLRFERGRLKLSGHVRRHLAVLGGLFLMLLAWSYRLDAFRLLLEGSGDGGVFAHVDHRIGIPANLVLALASVVASMLLVWSGWVGQWRVAAGTLVGVLLLAVGLRVVLPALSGRVLGPVSGVQRERPYLATRAAFSRRAFDVDRIRDVIPDTARSAAAAPAAALWDAEAIQQAIGVLGPSGRSSGALGWVERDGRPHALVAQPPSGPAAAEPLSRWRLTLADAALTGENGSLLRPAIANELLQRVPSVIVGDSVEGAGIVFDSVDAIAAPRLVTWADRIAHAWGLQNPRLLRGPPFSREARLVRFRDVRERVERLYPFFAQSNRVTPVVAGDSLFWALHLFSSSEYYPLSEPIVTVSGDVRYFKHAALALVNAHTGRAIAVTARDADPMARSWFRRFPELFIRASALREDLLRQLPPPGDGVLAQTRVFARYGRRGEVAPASHIARETGSDTLFRFPGLAPWFDRERRRLTVGYPVLDAAGQLRGLVVGAGGAETDVEWLPIDSVRMQWSDALDALRQGLDSAASRARPEERPLVRGPVRVVANGRRVALVQTAYDWRAEAAPSVRWSAVLQGDSLRVERSMLAAFGLPEPALQLAPATPEAFRQRVSQLYRQMSDALTRGDFVTFGAAYEALGRLLRSSGPAP